MVTSEFKSICITVLDYLFVAYGAVFLYLLIFNCLSLTFYLLHYLDGHLFHQADLVCVDAILPFELLSLNKLFNSFTVHCLGVFTDITYLLASSLLKVLLIWHVIGRLIVTDEWVIDRGELVSDDELHSFHNILVWHSRECEGSNFLVYVCYFHHLTNATYLYD